MPPRDRRPPPGGAPLPLAAHRPNLTAESATRWARDAGDIEWTALPSASCGRPRFPGFLPSRHGFGFVNRWPAGPAFEWRVRYLWLGIGNVAEGLCGGMCFAAADRFLRGDTPPAGATPPPAGTPLFDEIAHRQLDSLELGLTPLRFWLAAARRRAGRWTVSEQVREWRAIRADIDGGRPAMLGLVRSAAVNPLELTTNHQVVGYAYEAGAARATIWIYDPNHPGRDDVTDRAADRGRLDRTPTPRATRRCGDGSGSGQPGPVDRRAPRGAPAPAVSTGTGTLTPPGVPVGAARPADSGLTGPRRAPVAGDADPPRSRRCQA